MRRFDAPFTAFRLWWRGTSNGPRSRALVAGAAMFGILIWIAIPSGGGLLTNFAAGFPTGAPTQLANATAPAPGQGSQPPLSTSDLAAPSSVSTGAAGLGADTSGGPPSDNGAAAEGVSADTGAASGTSGSGEPGPTTPSSTCPVSFPSTNSPLDGLASQLSALCAQLLGGGSGTVPTGSLPGGGSAAQAGGPSRVPKRWMYLDAPVAASGAPNASWSPALSAEMAGKAPTVPVGLVQGAPVSPALAGAVGDLVNRGVLVRLVLVPQPTAPGGPSAFAAWAAQVLTALQPVQRVEIGTGAAPQGSSAGTVASYAVAGLTAAHDAPGRPTTGVVWLDGGTASADAPAWTSLGSAGAWSKSSFVARAFDATGACSSPAAFSTALRRYPVAAALPVVAEAVQAPTPAAWVAADYRCVKGAEAQGPASSVTMWRLWEGPVPR